MAESATETAGRPPLSGALQAALWMLAFSATFAVTGTLVRLSAQNLHPFEITFFRNLFGILVMAPLFMRAGRSALRTERIGLHLFRSGVGLLAMFCMFAAMSLMPLAEATALTFTTPLFATIGAALVLRETVRARRWTATAIGFVGALIILRPGVAAVSPVALVALASALLVSISMLAVKSLSRTETATTMVLFMVVIQTPLSLVPALFVWEWPDARTWVLLVALGVVATAGQLMMARAFACAEASVVLPFDFFRLIFIAVAAFAFFGEVPDLWTWVGAAVIFTSTVYIAHRESRLGARPPPAAAPPA